MRVEFHTGVADPAEFAGRLLRKAWRLGSRVLLVAPEPVLGTVDRVLWVQDDREFVPHVRLPGAPEHVLLRTPLWLTSGLPEGTALPAGLAWPPVLVNAGGALVPEGVAADGDLDVQAIAQRHQRVIEVVADDPAQAQAGRARWRAWRAAGCDVVHVQPR